MVTARFPGRLDDSPSRPPTRSAHAAKGNSAGVRTQAARALLLGLGWLLLSCSSSAAEKAEPVFTPFPHAQFRFEGPVGQRVKANVDQWLLTAPVANPGMLEMFRVRARQPTPELVPWAGEFVGK